MIKIRLPKKQLVLFSLSSLLIIGVLICLITAQSIAPQLLDQQAARRWAGGSETAYTQLSCFISSEAAPTLDDIAAFSNSVDNALLAASLEAADNGSLWTQAYSSQSRLTVTGSYGSAEAAVWGVGGDFFLFHPLPLRYGSYIADDDVMLDRVVIDEDLAWRTYGSLDVAGLELTISGRPYQIAGVVSSETDRYTAAAYSGGPRLYLSYQALKELNGSAPITCYEVILPNPISSFGRNLLQDNFLTEQRERGLVQIIENSSRFDMEQIVQVLTHFDQRTLRQEAIAYPYWENAARLAENQLARTLLAGTLCALFPAGCLIYLLIKEAKHGKHYLKKLKKSLR